MVKETLIEFHCFIAAPKDQVIGPWFDIVEDLKSMGFDLIGVVDIPHVEPVWKYYD